METETNRSILRWGGLAGLAGGIVTIIVSVLLIGFVPPAPADPAGLITRFTQVRAVITAVNVLDVIAYLLFLTLILSLYRVLRGGSKAASLFGTAISIVGITVLLIGTQTQVAFSPIVALYQAPGVTSTDRAILTVAWQTIQALFDEFDTTGGLLLSLGFVVLGCAMVRTQGFGKGYGWLSIVLGGVALVGVWLRGVVGLSSIPPFFFFPLFIIIPIALGWRVHRLSRQ